MCHSSSFTRLSSNKWTEKMRLSISIFLCLFSLVCVLYRAFLSCLANNVDYTEFVIPELMINFQGGFVRRGLLGELLFQAFQLHPYPVHTVILYAEAFILVVFLGLSCWVFYRLRYIPIMAFAILIANMTAYRRDFLLLLLAYLIFYLLINYVTRHRYWSLGLSIATTCLAVLLYEPSFFFIVPLSIFLFYRYDSHVCNRSRRILNTLLTFSLPLLTMALTCIYKGNRPQADAIWQSWSPLFDYLGIQQPVLPDALGFLAWSQSIDEVTRFHLSINYGIGQGYTIGFNYLLISGSLLFFLGMYFIQLTTPHRDSTHRVSTQLSSLYIFQFICLLPMFTILSCDFCRTIIYVIFTSFFLEYLFKVNNLSVSIPYIDKFSNFVTSLLNPITPSWRLVLYLAIILFIPFGLFEGFYIDHSFFFCEYWPKICFLFDHLRYSLIP